MGKIEFLALDYSQTAPGVTNRLNLTLASSIRYERALYLKYMEVVLCRVYDTVTAPFTERTISSCSGNIVSNGVAWMTRPQSATLGGAVNYLVNGYGVSFQPANAPARIELGDIYLASTQDFSVTAQIYCPGIINTDRVDMNIRIGFEFEATTDYSSKNFDIQNINY
jgi:hypothetical protein